MSEKPRVLITKPNECWVNQKILFTFHLKFPRCAYFIHIFLCKLHFPLPCYFWLSGIRRGSQGFLSVCINISLSLSFSHLQIFWKKTQRSQPEIRCQPLDYAQLARSWGLGREFWLIQSRVGASKEPVLVRSGIGCARSFTCVTR